MNIKKDNISKYLFFLVVIDILILPYFPFFAINTLFFLVFYDLVFFKNIFFNRKITILSILFIMIALISTGLSYYSDSYNLGFFSENIKRYFQFLLFIIYYFYFYNFFKKNEFGKQIGYIIDLFFLSVFIWSCIYYFSLDSFLKLKNIFNSNDSFINMYEDGENPVYRFSYIWTDPNNIAYAILGVFIFSLFNIKTHDYKSFLYLGVVLFVCLISMSTTAWLILFSIVLPCFFYKLNFQDSKTLIFTFLLTLFILFFGTQAISNILMSDIALQSFDRFQSNNIGSESGLSRLEIWSKVYSYYESDIHKYIFLGQGYQLHYKDRLIKPHNGIFLIFFAYGFFALILFLYIFFKFKLKRTYIFMVPFFLCFFINVMIGELKLFLLYVFLLAFVRAKEFK